MMTADEIRQQEFKTALFELFDKFKVEVYGHRDSCDFSGLCFGEIAVEDLMEEYKLRQKETKP